MTNIAYHVESLFRGTRFRLTRKLRAAEPSVNWPGIETAELSLRPFLNRFGNVSLYELVVICATARHTGAHTVFEFGTFDGLTTWHLAANCGPAARIWTLDLPLDHPARQAVRHDRKVGKIQGNIVGRHFIHSRQADQIEQLYADSMQFDASPYRDRIDLCFIDAGHGHENVRRDTENALAMTRSGGVIFWHDYSRWWPGVQKVLDRLSTELPVHRIAETSLGCLVKP